MKREKVLETILVISLGLVVLSVVLHVRALIAVALVIGLVGLFAKPLAALLARLWMKLAAGLGFVASRILLTLVFFLVLCPVALLHRLFVKNRLQLNRSAGGSYYVERGHQYAPRDFENTW